ncbi:Plasmid partitioning protein RepB (plasmid) [Paracoccaceae bacterium]|nr:Plasmid partitioning protein RepB [Paracoccaceae bacterium]
MKRSIPRSVLKNTPKTEDTAPEATEETAAPVPAAFRSAGAGSAWKSGALAQTQEALDRGRDALVTDILEGRHELSIPPGQISDPIGTDRRDDWLDQEAFQTLMRSIEANGQDTPIQVWPADPDWRPDPLNPTKVDGARFWMLTGRRRHAAAGKLGRDLRAILVPASQRAGLESKFGMLFLRFRENEERENLGAFERLVSIGEMYESLAQENAGGKLTATAFATRIGVHESIVSRARAVFKAQDQILNAFKNVYDMSFRDLQAAMAEMNTKPKPTPAARPKKLEVTRKIGSRKLSVASEATGLTMRAAGMKLDKTGLGRLSDVIAAFLDDELNKAGK